VNTIILFPKGQLKPADKARLVKADYIPIEVDEPAKVVMMFPNCERLTGDILTSAALNALTGTTSGTERQKFATEIINRLLAPK